MKNNLSTTTTTTKSKQMKCMIKSKKNWITFIWKHFQDDSYIIPTFQDFMEKYVLIEYHIIIDIFLITLDFISTVSVREQSRN